MIILYTFNTWALTPDHSCPKIQIKPFLLPTKWDPNKHCLLRPVFPSTKGKIGISNDINEGTLTAKVLVEETTV